MKLRNKKTGEIVDNIWWDSEINELCVEDGKHMKFYCSLAKLNEEWEDYEEPKEYWFIDYDGGIVPFSHMKETATDRMMKQIGNYFDTLEEAEKAVEKLKAFKRLKDKGFKFDRWNNSAAGPYRPIWFYFEKDTDLKDIKSDLDLLFSGGEE